MPNSSFGRSKSNNDRLSDAKVTFPTKINKDFKGISKSSINTPSSIHNEEPVSIMKKEMPFLHSNTVKELSNKQLRLPVTTDVISNGKSGRLGNLNPSKHVQTLSPINTGNVSGVRQEFSNKPLDVSPDLDTTEKYFPTINNSNISSSKLNSISSNNIELLSSLNIDNTQNKSSKNVNNTILHNTEKYFPSIVDKTMNLNTEHVINSIQENSKYSISNTSDLYNKVMLSNKINNITNIVTPMDVQNTNNVANSRTEINKADVYNKNKKLGYEPSTPTDFKGAIPSQAYTPIIEQSKRKQGNM